MGNGNAALPVAAAAESGSLTIIIFNVCELSITMHELERQLRGLVHVEHSRYEPPVKLERKTTAPAMHVTLKERAAVAEFRAAAAKFGFILKEGGLLGGQYTARKSGSAFHVDFTPISRRLQFTFHREVVPTDRQQVVDFVNHFSPKPKA